MPVIYKKLIAMIKNGCIIKKVIYTLLRIFFVGHLQRIDLMYSPKRSSQNVARLSLTSLGCLQDDKAIVAIANPINKFLVFILLLFLVDYVK